MKTFKFIDLFAGIGGFHQAMNNLGGECVLASEIDESAIKTYRKNYNIDSAHDINEIRDEDIPDHDVLCAGFPCQTFSKAGKQMGFADPTKGTLFFQIKRILLAKKPEYIVLENVRNLLSHDHHNTWKVIESELDKAGYNIKAIVMSPHQLGIPQLRERVYILGIRKDVYNKELFFDIPEEKGKTSLNAYEAGIFDDIVDDKYSISKAETEVLTCWNEFYQGINVKVIGFPVWSSEFGATYPLDDYPEWKAEFCRKNRKLYEDNKPFIDQWLKKWNNLQNFTPTNRKFEWQAGTSIKSIWDGYIQFRPSGIRVKRPDAFPALVALVQIPVIGKYKRRLTPREAARLQSFPETFIPDENDFQAYKQFGNAVNVNCVEYLAKQLFGYGHLSPDGEKTDRHGTTRKKGNTVPMQMVVEDGTLSIEYAKDSTRTKNEIVALVKDQLGDSFEPIEYRRGQRIVTGKYVLETGSTIYLTIANLTFMGGKEGQHPKDLKRIQYNSTWKEFYDDFSTKGEVLWLGLYSYKDINVWAYFKPETYLAKHADDSMISKGGHKAQYSCHIFLNDLYQGVEDGFFEKTDKNNNIVGSIKNDCLKSFFASAGRKVNPIVETIKLINNMVDWNNWILASTAIPYMRRLRDITGFKMWKQNKWNGWIIEAIYSEYLKNHPSEYIDYVSTTTNEEVIVEYKKYKLDLAFPKKPYYFIGDLKAVCEGNGDTLLNDEKNIEEALKKYKRIWFIIYIHDKKPGKTDDYEMVKWRNQYILNQGEWDYKVHPEYDPMSADQTPHSVAFKEMVIVELNEITKDKYFTIGAQWGPNSDGNERNDKFKINKKMLEEITDDSFVIYRYRPKEEN